jgi:hypothetical protein
VLPAPAVQQPGVPIIVAGDSRGTLRLAAKHADALDIGPAAWAGGAYTADDVEDRFRVDPAFWLGSRTVSRESWSHQLVAMAPGLLRRTMGITGIT